MLMALGMATLVLHFGPNWNISPTMDVKDIFEQTFMVPTGLSLKILVISSDSSCSATARLTFVVFSEMSPPLLDGLPWNYILMSTLVNT